MTSVIAWLAVDSRQPTALYFASDSRITINGRLVNDCTKKLFVPHNSVETFAFSGDVAFASTSLDKLCRSIEADCIPCGLGTSPYGRTEWICDFLQSELSAAAEKPAYNTTILHGSRHSWGAKASFTLHALTVQKGNDSLEIEELFVDLKQSSYIEICGSGRLHVRSAVGATVKVAGNYSRAYFAGFCESVMSGNDELSGGPVQLVGVGCKSYAQHFGVVSPSGAFFQGMPQGVKEGVKWRNFSFEEVTHTGALLDGAQRHAW
ncbi:MAG: hypothetical protein ACYCSS_09795 [Sulfuriferula sp.]